MQQKKYLEKIMCSEIRNLDGLYEGKKIQKVIREAKINNDRDYLVMKLLGVPVDKLESIYAERGLPVPEIENIKIETQKMRKGMLKSVLDIIGVTSDKNSTLEYLKNIFKSNTSYHHEFLDVKWNKYECAKQSINTPNSFHYRKQYESVNPDLLRKVECLLNEERQKDYFSLIFMFPYRVLDENNNSKNMELGWDVFEGDLSNSKVVDQYALLVAIQLLNGNNVSNATCASLIRKTFLSNMFDGFNLKGGIKRIEKLKNKVDIIFENANANLHMPHELVIKEIMDIEDIDLFLQHLDGRSIVLDEIHPTALKDKIDKLFYRLDNEEKNKKELSLDEYLEAGKKKESFEVILKDALGIAGNSNYNEKNVLVRAKISSFNNSCYYRKKEVLDRIDDFNDIYAGMCNLMSQVPGILCKIKLPIDKDKRDDFYEMSNTWMFGPKEWIEVIENSQAEKEVKEGSAARKESNAIANDDQSSEAVFAVVQ